MEIDQDRKADASVWPVDPDAQVAPRPGDVTLLDGEYVLHRTKHDRRLKVVDLPRNVHGQSGEPLE
jgi:hypothetical protein